MKKFTIIISASLFLLPGIMTATDFKVSSAQNNPATSHQKMAEKVGQAARVIYDAPDGENVKFERSGITFTLYGEPMWYDNSPADMVFCDNGDVYFQAPFFSYAEPSYIVGHRDGDKVIFDLPQTVVYQDYGGGYIYSLDATLGQFDQISASFIPVNSEEAIKLGFPEVENQLILTVDENGVYKYDSGLKVEDDMLTVDNGDIILCMCDTETGYWQGPAEVNFTLTPFEGKLITPPIGIETESMGFTYNGTGHLVEVGFIDDEVYIKGLVDAFPNSWIKGTTNGNLVNVPSTQYLGESFRYAAFIYYASAILDKETGMMTLLDSVDFYYDPETKTFSAPQNVVGLYNGAVNYIHYVEMYEDMMIRPQMENPAITLNAPYNIYYIEEGYYPYVEFTYSTLNKEGYLLNPERLYYKMYVNGDEYTFFSDEYYTETDMTFVPVSFNDYFNFLSENGVVQIYLSFEGFETLGFRLFYADADEAGEVTKVIAESEMGMYESGTVKVGTIETANKTEVVYYDIMGRRVYHPSKGDLLIERCGSNTRKIIF